MPTRRCSEREPSVQLAAKIGHHWRLAPVADFFVSRHRMRLSVLLPLMVLSPMLALAELQWHRFGTAGEKNTIPVGRVTVTVELQKDQTSGFPDDLLMTVKTSGHKPNQFCFASSYAFGSVAVQGNILFLKYGVG